MAYIADAVIVSVRVGHRKHVEVDVVEVLWVGGVILDELLDEVGANGGGDPLTGMNSWTEKELCLT